MANHQRMVKYAGKSACTYLTLLITPFAGLLLLLLPHHLVGGFGCYLQSSPCSSGGTLVTISKDLPTEQKLECI